MKKNGMSAYSDWEKEVDKMAEESEEKLKNLKNSIISPLKRVKEVSLKLPLA